MRISEYPYGKVTKSLRKAVEHLNRNYVKIIKNFLNHKHEKYSLEDISYFCHDGLDWPEFELRKSVYCRLNTDEVDFLQEGWYDLVKRYKI